MIVTAIDLSHGLEGILNSLMTQGAALGWTLIKAFLVFIVGRLLINLVNKLIKRVLLKRDIDPSVKTFVGSLVNVVLTILLIISVVGALGVQTTSFAALLASAGVAVGMALSGNLANFAGGLIILLFKPFKVGDYIEGRYYVTSNTYMDDKPSVNLAKGQWYIKETDGKYSIVDRSENTTFASLNSEAFAVQGMANTYTFGSSTDSVTIEFQPVNLNDHYLGSLYFTENELNDNGYVLNLISGTTGVSNIYAYTTDSILKGKVGDAKDAAIFKLIPSDTVSAGGAVTLGDELFVISYKLKGLFNSDTITAQSDSLKFSKSESALSFKFISDATAEKYAMLSSTNQYVGMNVNTSCVQLSEKAAYVNLEAVDAPEYASFASAHKRLAYNNNALAMNPLNFFAEMKDEGNPITKTNYGADNFSLWVEQDTVIAGKQLYFISSGVANGGKAEANIRYYLAAKDTTRAGIDADTYAMFISHDSIKTMKNNPALFAFKTAEEGGYYLENQKELNENGKPYVGVVNGFAVMQATPSAAFEVQTASAPTANEEMNVSEIKVISNDGQVIVTNASGKMITLSNILGQIIGVRRANSEYFSMPATSGIVLVTVEGDATYKVIVK